MTEEEMYGVVGGVLARVFTGEDQLEEADGGYNTPCWFWLGKVTERGYGQVKRNDMTLYVHRVAYIVTYGEIPEDLIIDHLCRQKLCCRPDHLELVTQRENIQRAAVQDGKRIFDSEEQRLKQNNLDRKIRYHADDEYRQKRNALSKADYLRKKDDPEFKSKKAAYDRERYKRAKAGEIPHR